MSIIQKVEIEGYRSVGARQVIDLSKPGLVLLTGDNRDRGVSSGAGKSTIFKAITTCLFEENDDGSIKKNGVNAIQQDRGLRIGLNFADDYGTNYYAVYSYLHPTDGTDWYLWEWDGKKWRDKREEKKGDTRGVIQKILRMDYSQFLNRAYMAQETVAEFIWRTQKERTEIFSGILGLGAIDTWVQSARDWKKDTDRDLQEGKGKIALLDQQIARVKTTLKTDEEVQALRDDLAAVDSRIVEVENLLEEKREDAQRINALVAVKANQKAQEQIVANLKERKAAIGPEPKPNGLTEESVKKAKQAMDEAAEKAQEWLVKLRTIEANVAEKSALGDTCGACEQPITGDQHRRLMEKYESQRKGIEINEVSWRGKADARKAEYDSIKTQFEAVYSKTCEHHRIDAEIRKADGILASYTKQIEEMRKVLGDAVDYPDRLNDEFRTLSDRQIALNKDRSAKQATLNAALEAHDQHRGLVADRDRQEAANAALDEQITYLKKVETSLGDRGFRSYKIRSSRTSFNNSLNRYLSVLTDGEVEAELVTEVPKADGKGTKSELDIIVQDGEKAGVPIRQYSGGEKGTLSLGITGSFWDLSSHQSGGSVNLLLLDEPFANMDPWQIEKACKLLESMRESGRTILVVTNQQSVRDRGFFDREIRAVKENHITHFELFDLSSNH